MATWDAIECTELNGELIGYLVEFLDQNGDIIYGEVDLMYRSFASYGLAPAADYSFRVAAVTIIGTGPVTERFFISTTDDSKYLIIPI